jgi:hypothetical protein
MKTQKLTNWNDLDNIDEMPPFAASDLTCLEEVKAVLERHGKSHVFGVNLLHKHFDLADDEIMLETQDAKARTLHSHAVKLSELERIPYVVTVWRFDTGQIRPMGGCATSPYRGHFRYVG